MGGAVVVQAELGEDRSHVSLDGAVGEPEVVGDGAIRVAFSDEPEHLLLTLRQVVEGGGSRPRSYQGSDDLWVKGGATVCHAADGSREVVELEHAVFEEVPEPWASDQAENSAAAGCAD